MIAVILLLVGGVALVILGGYAMHPIVLGCGGLLFFLGLATALVVWLMDAAGAQW